jgi:hypothetical protein
MPNGAVVRLPLELQPPSPPAPAVTDKPTAGIEATKIGSVVADAAEIFAMAMAEYDTGGALSQATRTASGERLGRVAEEFLSAFGELPNLVATAHHEGRRTLLARHAAILRQHYGLIPEAAINELLDHVVAIASKVARDEMAFRAN